MADTYNIYSREQRWKVFLFLLAMVIVALSLWYTKQLVDKIANEERKKVTIWADAVQRRSDLVHFTNQLFQKLQAGERNKVELYLEATRYLARPDVSDVSFALKVLNDNTTVPVILTNELGQINSHRNIQFPDGVESEAYLSQQLADMARSYKPIEIVYYGQSKLFLYYKDSEVFTELKSIFNDLQQSFISDIIINAASSPIILMDSALATVLEGGNVESSILSDPELLREKLEIMRSQHQPLAVEINGAKAWVFYEDSFLLTQIKYYPLAQIGIIGLFMLIAYLLFSTARRAEQNSVWVGMSKETAHQLGTPLSSMLGWVEMLKDEPSTKLIAAELEKDVSRLRVVTERFSKIGSLPELEEADLIQLLEETVDYFRLRSGRNVHFDYVHPSKPVLARLNYSLFEWVIENLIKNALDAMEGKGTLKVEVVDQDNRVLIDITDSGKGINPAKFKTIFKPGFTTKKRGWGLGLSLSKRIVRDYHKGKIYVLRSEPGVATTFRISLRKSK